MHVLVPIKYELSTLEQGIDVIALAPDGPDSERVKISLKTKIC